VTQYELDNWETCTQDNKWVEIASPLLLGYNCFEVLSEIYIFLFSKRDRYLEMTYLNPK
jgi:hypothetical protein